MSDIGDRARRIVGDGFDHHRHAAGPVTLVCHFLIIDAFELAGTLLDRPLDVLLRHRVGACVLHRGAQSRVAVGITAPLLCRERDLANELCEQRAPLRVSGRFIVLDLLPFTMTSHMQLYL